jgi:hypothetical protein
MRGLDSRIHLLLSDPQDVDGRVKPGHDDGVSPDVILSVIASQRVGAKRRPMTGSAKQSSLNLRHARTGLLRRFAPRNDDEARCRHLYDASCAGLTRASTFF